MNLAPLPVAILMITAALLAALSNVLPRRVADFVSLLASGAVTAVCALLAIHSAQNPIVYWFGGWQPRSGAAIGISFVIDPIGAGWATLVSLLSFCALLFSSNYFRSVKTLYHTLMLVFQAAMCGFCLTGDVFNLFVWFELMSAAAVALCGYKSEEIGPLQGAFNFAITNTVGAFLTLTGVALIYAQTGALNLAQIGRTIAAHPDPVYLISFLFIVSGFLVKAAMAPFHFWLADAHAVAPTPVCVLFSGVMVELGLYGVARVYWGAFAPTLAPHVPELRAILVGMGTATALIGAVMCASQRHFKRLLAYSTISHAGLMMTGIALFQADAWAGSCLYALGHGFVKSTLFLGSGILLYQYGELDEFHLRGQARKLVKTGLVLAVAALALASLPYTANFFGESRIDEAAEKLGYSWLSYVFLFSGIFTGGAALRFIAHVFMGEAGGPGAVLKKAKVVEDERETDRKKEPVPTVMILPAVALLALAWIAGSSATLRAEVLRYAEQFTRSKELFARVLEGATLQAAPLGAREGAEGAALVRSIIAALGSLVFAALGVSLPRLQVRLKLRPHLLSLSIRGLRRLHSGLVNDYIAWLVFGMALYGGLAYLLGH